MFKEELGQRSRGEGRDHTKRDKRDGKEWHRNCRRHSQMRYLAKAAGCFIMVVRMRVRDDL